MFDAIIKFSIYNKVIIILMALGLVGWGAYSLSRLPIDALPDVTNNQVQIITISPTFAAQEVERFITYPIELSMASLPQLEEVRSISRSGLSVVTVVFEDAVDQYLARQWVTERLSSAREQMPTGIGTPELAPPTTGLGEIYQYCLEVDPAHQNTYSLAELRSVQDWIVKRQILGTPGVAEVSSFGGYLKEYEVAVEPELMRAYNITFQDLLTTLENNNENTGGAYIEKDKSAYYIRGLGQVQSLEQIANLVITNRNNSPLKIQQVAQVRAGSAPRYGALTRNGKGETVGGIIMMRKGENSAQVVQAVKARMKQISQTLPAGIRIVPFLDRTRLVDTAIYTVQKNLIEGGVIVVAVLVLVLGSIRAGLIVTSVIPLAMLFAVGMMNIFKVSGNLMSLGAIDFGLIVDGAVIIVESILHRITLPNVFNGKKSLPQAEFDSIVYEQAKRIRQSAAFGEIIILIVYVPILTLAGIEGKMFQPMALTVGFAILGALILSLTYVPALSALLLNRRPPEKPSLSERVLEHLAELYGKLLAFALRIKALILGFALALGAVAVYLFMYIGGEFIPTLEEGDFAVQVSILPGSSLAQTVQTTTAIEKILLAQFPEVVQVVSKIGSSEIPTDPMAIETGDIMVILKDKNEWQSATTREELANKMQTALAVLPGVNLSFQQPIQMRFNELMTGAKTDVAIQIYGENLDTLALLAQKVSGLVNPIPGVQDLYVEKVTGLPQITIRYKDDKIGQYGLSRKEINTVIRAAFAGAIVGQVYEGERRFNLTLRLAPAYRHDIQNIEQLYIEIPEGTKIPLSEVAEIFYEEGPMQISRENTRRRITIGFNVRDTDVASLVEVIQPKLTQALKLPTGYTWHIGGEFENLISAQARLAVAIPVALALIFILLYISLGSALQAVLIFTAIPLSAIGGILALWLRDMPFSISAGIGFIALFGVAVLNGLVLIGHYNELKDLKGEEKVIQGAKDRLRAVLVTALTASLGFLPMAISTSGGAEVQRPLATVVIGGLLTATFLTLFILPILYRLSLPKKAITTLLIFVIMGGGATVVQAQVRLSPEEAADLAKQNAPEIQLNNQNIYYRQKVQQTYFDLPATNATVSYGNINQFGFVDYSVQVGQAFHFPTYYTVLKSYYASQTQEAELERRVQQQIVSYETKRYAYQWLYYQMLTKLLHQYDSLYQETVRAAEKRLAVGEGSALELSAASARQKAIQTRIQMLAKEQLVAINQLQYFTGQTELQGITGSFVLQNENYEAELRTHPTIQLLTQAQAVAEQAVKVEKARQLPIIEPGYLNQSIEHKMSGHVFSIGLTAPLNLRTQKHKIEAAQINAKALATKQAITLQRLETDLANAQFAYQKYLAAVQYYQSTGKKLAQEILTQAVKAYRAGEIDFIAYSNFITQALDIEESYLENQHSLNHSILQVFFLSGVE